jgi:transposase
MSGFVNVSERASILVVPPNPPKSNRLHPWNYDHAVYKKRNEIERLFRRLKGFRRIFSRFEKLDALFLGFLSFRTHRRGLARSVNTP